QVLDAGLLHRIDQLWPVRGPYADPAPLHGPSLFMHSEDVESYHSVEHIQASRSQHFGDTIQMIEKLRVSSHVQRSKQNVSEIELARTDREACHITSKEGEIGLQLLRPPTRKSDHFRAGIEAEAAVTPLVPLF